MTPVILKTIQEYMISQYPNEGCGFVVNDVFIPVQNTSKTPEKEFLVSPEDTVRYNDLCEMFVHSHPDWYNCPSKLDMSYQQSSKKPWGIVSTTSTACSGIQMFGAEVPTPDIMNRTFCHGVTDCCTLINDWGKINNRWIWEEVPRDWEWWLQEGVDLYQQNFARVGFIILDADDVKKNGPEVGDVFLAAIHSNKLNHGGVYLGNGLGLHHLTSKFPVDATRVPKQEPLARWSKYIHTWARYTGEVKT